jgi:integral membrane protein
VSGSLARYRVMAYCVGTGLAVLCVIGIPLQYLANKPAVVQIVGPIHGFLYIIYLVTAYDLARRARFTLLQLAAMICAGLVPGLAFVLERRVVRRVREEEAAGLVGNHLVPRVALRATPSAAAEEGE